MTDPDDDEDAAGIPDSVAVPIDGVLDLHTFHPRDLRTLIRDYLAECRARGILSVRLIHGKGTGAVRDSVHALLKKQQAAGVVLRYGLAEPMAGGWGATLVDLAPPAPAPAVPE